MKKVCGIAIALVFLFSVQAQAKELTQKQIMQGVCRISTVSQDNLGRKVGVRRGTGTIIGKDTEKYFILTNGHVATRTGTKVYLEFFNDGRKSQPILADVVWRYYKSGTSIDAAIVTLPISALKGYEPQVIPLAPKKYVVNVDDKIYGAGCPNGWWLQYWETRVIRMHRNTIIFEMPPIGGQSGSGILTTVTIGDEKFTRLVGMITWRFGGNSHGGGVNLPRLRELFTGQASPDTIRSGNHVSHEHDKKCGLCKKTKAEHFIIKRSDGSYKSENGKPSMYCPSYLDKEVRIHGKENCVLYGEEFPRDKVCLLPPFLRPPQQPPNDRPPIGEQPNPFPIPSDEVNRLKERIRILESTLRDLEKTLTRLANEGLIAGKTITDLKDIKTKLEGNLRQTENHLSNVSGVLVTTNKQLKEEKTKREKALGLLAKIAGSQESRLNKINIPFFNQWGGFGTALAAILNALVGGTIVTLVWHKFAYPRLMKRFGWFPTKILERIGKRKLSKYIQKRTQKSSDSGYNTSGQPDGVQKEAPLPFLKS